MRMTVGMVAVLVAMALCLPASVAAQKPVTAFDQLNTRVSIGDTVRVVDGQGREVKGRILELHDASITLKGTDQTTLQADDVRLVRQSRTWKGFGCLIGLGIGAAVGLAYEASVNRSAEEETSALILSAAVGAGAGVAVGALFPRVRDVYRAPGGAASRLAISPMVTPRAKGVVLSFSF
jgi:hypothetical protein